MTGMRFRETMSGRVALRAVDPVAGYESKGAFATSMRAEVEIDDVAAFLAGRVHTARLRAELIIPVLGGRFVSSDGSFVLLSPGNGPNGRVPREMVYEATFVNDDRIYAMVARKILRPGRHPWRDTTTAYVTLHDETCDEDGIRPRDAAGVIEISLGSFLHQLTTMRGFGADGRWGVRRWWLRQWAVFGYAALFVKGLVKTYLLGQYW